MASRHRRLEATVLNDYLLAGGDPCRRQRSQRLLSDVKRAVRSLELVCQGQLEAALSFHSGHRSGLAACENRYLRRHHSVVEHRVNRSCQPLKLLFWQQFSVSNGLDQGTEQEAASYVELKAVVGLLVWHQSHLLQPDLHSTEDGRLAPEC